MIPQQMLQQMKFYTTTDEVLNNLTNLESIKDFEKMATTFLSYLGSGSEVITEFLKMMSDKPKTEKDSTKSKKARNEGNCLYAKSKSTYDFYEVFRLYNESIAYAPNKSEELALAYANRAMVLFRLNYFNECLADINRALCANYPDKTITKLLIKKVRCMKIVNHPDLQIIYKDTLKWIDEHSVNVQELKADLQKAYEQETQPYTALCDEQIRNDLLDGLKKSCPNLEKVEIKRNDKDELILVASRDIHVGEVVALQKVYTQVSFEDESPYLSCVHCITLCVNPIPCDRCAIAVYCSESCKAEAWAKHHQNECQVINYMQGFDITLQLPVRVFMYAMKQLGGILPLMKEVLKMSKTDDMKKEHRIINGVYPSESYRSVYYMISKQPIDRRRNYFKIAERISAFVYFVATHTTLFNKQYQGDLCTVVTERVPKFVVSLMLRHYMMFQHLQEFRRIGDGNQTMQWVSVCPLFNILNHSCNPNTLKLTIRDHHVLVAVDEIKKGQEIICSSTRRALIEKPLAVRSQIIKERFFGPCKCDACAMKIPHDLDSFQVLETDPQKLEQLSIIHDRIIDTISKHLLSLPKTAAEFFQQAAELFPDLKLFFAMAPLCKEVIIYKNYLMDNVYFDMFSKVDSLKIRTLGH